MRYRRHYIWVVLLAAAAISLGGAAGSAHFWNLGATTMQGQMPPPPHGGPGGLDPRLLDQLNLSDAQKTQIKALQEAQRTDSQPYREELMQAREAIRNAVEASTYDETVVQAQAVIVGQAMADLTIVEARTEAANYQILTAEQRASLAALRKQMGPPPR